jgi:2-polyprenyl-3-methyl-5-hydroxy-6-metoxy-1,4-benzoquinol methylase
MMFGALKNFLYRRPRLRNAVRELRWQLKRIPLLRKISVAFDRAYFSAAGTERRTDRDEETGEYFESYAGELTALSRGDVLDLGCGYGYLTERIARSDSVQSVLAIDKIDEFRCPHSKIRHLTLDLASVPSLPGSFDTIIASEFVEHVSEEEHDLLLHKIACALRPGGIYIGSTPENPTPYSTFSGSRFHVREYSAADLRKILTRHFRKVSVRSLPTHCLVWEAADAHARS